MREELEFEASGKRWKVVRSVDWIEVSAIGHAISLGMLRSAIKEPASLEAHARAVLRFYGEVGVN